MSNRFVGNKASQMNTEQWAPLLRPYWDRGMTSWKESQLIAEAVQASNGRLTVERVKMWIANYRKKMARVQRDVLQKGISKRKREEYDEYTNVPAGPAVTTTQYVTCELPGLTQESKDDYSVITPAFGATDNSSPMNTDQWAPILKPYWDRGMTSWKETQLIAEAVHATGGQLDTEKVKTWISNYRKKITRPRKEFSPKAGKQKVTGYDIYCRAIIPLEVQNALQLQVTDTGDPNNTICLQVGPSGGLETVNAVVLPKETYTNFSLQWQSLSPDERLRYEQQAESENQMHQVAPHVSAERLRRKSMKIIQREMLKLQQLGCKGGMFLCVSPDSKKIMYSSDLEARSVFVSKESKEFRNMYLHRFKEGATGDDLSNQVALSKRSFLRRSVQRLFKRKYIECSGFCGAFPYNFFRRGICYATGLPVGVSIKTVGEYSVTQLQAILDAAAGIQFHKTNPEPHDPNTVDKSTLVQDSFQNMDASLYPMPQTETKVKVVDPAATPIASSKRSFLRRAVKSLFTQKYASSSGTEGAFPYSFFREGVYYATGMPMDLTVKTVGEYSVTQLQAILDAAGFIQFHKSPENPETIHQQGELKPQITVQQQTDLHSQPSDLHGQTTDIHGQPTDLHAQAAEMHAPPADILAQPIELHTQPTELHAHASQVHPHAAQVVHPHVTQVQGHLPQVHSIVNTSIVNTSICNTSTLDKSDIAPMLHLAQGLIYCTSDPVLSATSTHPTSQPL